MVAAWFLVNLGEWTFVTALSIHEYRLHGAVALGLIGARFVPGAVCGLAVLQPLTRRSPNSVLRTIAGLCGLSVAAAAFAVARQEPLPLSVAIVWLEAALSAPYRAIQATVLPALSDTPHELSAAAGTIPVAKALAWAAGALAGSVGLVVASAQLLMLLGAAGFLIAGALVGTLGLTAPGRPSSSSSPARARGRMASLAGFELIAQRVRALLVLGGARSLTRGVWTALTVVVSLRLLHLGSSGVGLLMAAAGLGVALAVPLSLRFAGRPRLAGPAALMFALAGLPITLVGVAAEPVSASAFVVVWGAAFAMADSLSNSLIHRVVEARLLAPSVGALESSKLLLEGVGALAAPGLLAVLGIRDTLLVVGLALPVLVLLVRRGLLAVDRRAERRTRPLAILRRTPSFTGLTMLALETLASRLERAQAPAGEILIRQNDVGDRFYLIDQGKVSVTIDGYRVAVLGPGESFGEKALLRAISRTATVTALEPTDLWYLDAADFVAAVTEEEGPVPGQVATRRPGRGEMHSLEETLRAIPLFGAFDRRHLASAGRVIEVSAGTALTREGEPGDAFFVVLGGHAEVTIGGRPVRTLSEGDWFGEIALIHDVPRTATVVAGDDARVFQLSRSEFLRVLRQADPRANSSADGASVAAGLLV